MLAGQFWHIQYLDANAANLTMLISVAYFSLQDPDTRACFSPGTRSADLLAHGAQMMHLIDSCSIYRGMTTCEVAVVVDTILAHQPVVML